MVGPSVARLVQRSMPSWARAGIVVIALADRSASAQRLDRDAARRASEDRVAERALTRAEQAIGSGRAARAITLLEQSARRLPRDPRAALRLCEITLPESDATVDA
ncbi:MAG: hypothetical protein J0L92_32775, partial [Deltaproteobacteria bacterium]|nr:hypothetical protein [Deltaproteobacteria bacterium]